MTPLPQRKKTAEEIAQLRDQLGVPPSVELSEESAPPEAEPIQVTEAAPTAKTGTLPAPSYPSATPQDSRPAAREANGLPTRRRSTEELEELQRREMLKQLEPAPITNFKFMAAHPALIASGYLMAATGVCSFWMESYPWPVIAGGSIGALLVAAFLFLRRPVSRHHAGFISAISVLVGVFATIHHFPQLQHAS